MNNSASFWFTKVCSSSEIQSGLYRFLAIQPIKLNSYDKILQKTYTKSIERC